MRIKGKIRAKLNQLSLKTQLTSLITITVTVIIIIIIMFNYNRNINVILSQQVSTSTTLLNLETQNLDTYLSEINRYSLLLRNDQKTLRMLATTKPLTYSDITNLQSQLKSNFYSRNDLLSYRLYLLKQSTNYEITKSEQMVVAFYDNSIESLPEYKAFTKGKYYNYIQPTEGSDSFFIYYRTIINIEDQRPIAVVELTFDTSFMDSLAQNRVNSDEILCVLNSSGQLLYSNNETLLSAEVCTQLNDKMNQEKENNYRTDLGGTQYLTVFNKSAKHEYSILILNPINAIDYQVDKTRNISLILGLLSITVSAVLAIVFIQLVTKPLSKLSHRLKKVGKGNFTTTTNIGGSREIAHLAESFNDMIHQIDELINKNYVLQLNEKTARLIALEAQINPHFLYNTLQAISAEAIVNKQFQLNTMVTSLASMLRYSINGGDFVMLKEEIKHVKDYLLLQHARFEDALTYDIVIDPATQDLYIPKISIQILVENSIIHGMGGDKASIHIHIESILFEDTFQINVSDNGLGITKEQCEIIYASFSNDAKPEAMECCIGLSNLYNRIKLLYGDQAQLMIDSVPNEKTTVSFTIPMTKGE